MTHLKRFNRMGRRAGLVVVLSLLAASFALAQSSPEYNAIGVQHYNAQEWEEAVDAFQKAYVLAPDNATIRRNLCNALQAQANELARESRFEEAMPVLESAILTDPQNANPLVQLGSYLLRMDLVTEAIFRLEEAVDLEAFDVSAHDLLGDAYYRDNDLSSALTQWEWVAKVAPDRAGLAEKIEKAQREDAVENRFRKSQSRHFTITFAPGTSVNVPRQVLRVLERAYRETGLKLGRIYPPGPIQVIVYSGDQFTEVTQLGSYVGAVYDGKIRAPLTDANGQPVPDLELERRLVHEYTHVVLRYYVGDNLPWWLNEGLAEALSKPLENNDIAYLIAARDNEGLPSLASFNSNQIDLSDASGLRLAYNLAHATVQYLLDQFGQRGIVNMLNGLAEGETPEDALRRCYHRSYKTLDREIADRLERLAES